MLTSDFDYELPKKFIAQNPAVPRDHSRLMVYDVKSDTVFHKRFFEVGEFLSAGDVLVVNRSKVVPARIIFKVGDSEAEIFLLGEVGDSCYEALVRPGKKFEAGFEIRVDADLVCRVEKINSDGSRVLKFSGIGDLKKKLRDLGQMPLPPYIDSSKADSSQYQTVYAREEGSVAAPTAGLHFTESLIRNLEGRGVHFAEVVLHVGRGTFLPVKTARVEDHFMHEEFFEMDAHTAQLLNKAKNDGRRIVAVGTTSVRVLESNFRGEFVAQKGVTNIFIHPGGRACRAIDALITNFHLPKSTLIMLVASFLESRGVADPVSKILNLYEIAKEHDYRFYSFGDAMLIV